MMIKINRINIISCGCNILIHQACIKLIFDVKDIKKFRNKCISDGLKFSRVHTADGYSFSNTIEPGRNTVKISNRTFKKMPNKTFQ